MCNGIRREATAPFKAEVSLGATYINDRHGLPVAMMAAPREDHRGPLTVDEMKRWIVDNTALFTTAPRLVWFIRTELIDAAKDGADQAHMMTQLQLLADACNTSVEFVWEQVRGAAELGTLGQKHIPCVKCGSNAFRMGAKREALCDDCFDDYLAEAA